MTTGRWTVSLVGAKRRHSAILYLTLVILVGCGPLGCGTLFGYAIGSDIDGGQFADLPQPYAESLLPLTGRVIRVTVHDDRLITGSLVGVEAGSEGGGVCFIGTERQAALPGWESQVDTIPVSSMLAVQVRRGGHTYRNAGIVVGVVIDATVISLLQAAIDRVGMEVSK